MANRLFNLLTLLSLLLCATVVALWRTSAARRRADGWQWATQEASSDGGAVHVRLWSFTVADGTMECARIVIPTTPAFAQTLPNGLSRTAMVFGPMGLGARRSQGNASLRLPAWSVAVMSAALPVAWKVRRRRGAARKARIRAGLCLECGYDLRASPGRCPECGETIPLASGGER
jgi:hypothetical protein